MKTSSFGYNLPKELIAQEPFVPRDACNMLVLNKNSGEYQDKHFFDIKEYLKPGDLLVANETRVIPARLIGKKSTGGKSEILLLNKQGDYWEAMVKPGKRLKPGAVVEFDYGRATIVNYTDRGTRLVKLEPEDLIHEVGKTPLPPYITDYSGDMEMYQTVYSNKESSAAAPTAGLHFTPELINELKSMGVGFETVELEVGIDTFKPVTEENIEDHVIHTERYSVSENVLDKIKQARRVVAVGTTSVRALESCNMEPKHRVPTSLFITPGYNFKVVDAMITNFHVPESTLMMLVSAFVGRDNIMKAYQHAIDTKYRFLSFGDAMLII